MIVLPPSVVDYLRSELLTNARPFCFLIDGSYRLIDAWGDGDWYELSGLEPGADMLEAAPYLLGSLGATIQKFEHVKADGGVDFHMHAIPDDAGY